MRKALATPIHLSWVALAFVAVMLFAVGYSAATTIDQRSATIADLTAELDQLEQYVPAYAGCREAAETGHALGWAWHDWVANKTQRNVDRVHELQDRQGEQLASCRLDESDEGAEVVGAVGR